MADYAEYLLGILVQILFILKMPVGGFEPPSLAAHGPKPCVSANFTTPAICSIHCLVRDLIFLWKIPGIAV